MFDEQINALTLEDMFSQVMASWAIANVPDDYIGPKWELATGESTRYERMSVGEGLVKPSESELNAILEVIKSELIAAENARLAEIARREALQARLSAISDIYGAVYKAGYSISNPALEEKRIIDEDDTQRLEEYEQASTLLAQDIAQAQINEQSRKYLASTDWYVIRETETGIPCPAEIKTQRTAARLAIVE